MHNEQMHSRNKPVIEAESGVEFRLDSRRVIRTILLVCIGLEIAFVLADYWINYREMADIGAIRRMFNITREDGLASFFGVTQTIFVALTLWTTWLVVRRQGSSTGRQPTAGDRWRAAGWFVLAGFFTYMAVDDGAMIHERLGTAVKTLGEDIRLVEAFPSFGWQLLFVPLLGGLGLFMLCFMWRELGARRSRWLVLAASACMAFAVGLDFIEGLDAQHPWNIYAQAAERYSLDEYTHRVFDTGGLSALRHFSRSLEETLEMFAMTLLWVVFLGHLARQARHVGVLVGPPDATVKGSARAD